MKEINKIVRLFKNNCPTSLEEILELGLWGKDDEYTHHKTAKISLEFVSQGSYRKVYRINKLPLVVKVPNGNDGEVNENGDDRVEHSQNEMDAIVKVQTDPLLKPLRKYLPTVYYHNDCGIILMKEYVGKLGGANCKKASQEIAKLLKKPEIDFWKNFLVEPDGNIVLLDWGLLGDLTDWYEYES